MLARSDEASPVWVPAKNEEAVLRPDTGRPAWCTEDRRMRLRTWGSTRCRRCAPPRASASRARTLAAGSAAGADWQYLAARRLGAVHRQQHRARHSLGGRGVAACRRSPRRRHPGALVFRGAVESRPSARGACRTPFSSLATSVPTPGAANFTGDRLCGSGQARVSTVSASSHSASGSKVRPVRLEPLESAHYSPAELEWVDAHRARACLNALTDSHCAWRPGGVSSLDGQGVAASRLRVGAAGGRRGMAGSASRAARAYS